jgi:FkbH-like protein
MLQFKEIRSQIDRLLDEGRWEDARTCLDDLWRRDGKAAQANYIASRYERLRPHVHLTKCRIAFLRSMTLEPLVPILRSAAFVSGIDLAIQLGTFNTYMQDILDPSSTLYSFHPEIVIIALQTRDIAPEIWDNYTDLSEAEIQAAVDRVREVIAVSLRTFREHCDASVILHTWEKPIPSEGVLSAQGMKGQLRTIDRMNAELREVCCQHRGIYTLDYDALISQRGRARWHDESKWLTMRMPFATDSLPALVAEWLKFVHPLTGTTCKVLAVDLDNTLWGGVLGEEGFEGIQMGPEYPGALYRSVQRALLDLYRRGILLAVCSKNSPEEAMSVLKNHPDMLLGPEHFAAFRINWQDKALNLREIAAELNVGIDTIAFLDDNPVEREQVRRELPEVKVLDWPARAEGFTRALRECPFFERLILSNEDRDHTKFYHEQRQRAQLAHRLGNLEDFYKSLDQEVVIAQVRPETIARVAQLTQKTNQYNVTTRRYSEQQIADIASKPGWTVYSVQVKDKFGDNGIVGVIIAQLKNGICEIETLLLSCRVIGRTIETAMLGFLAETSKANGARFLQGRFIPTKKNTPVRELYPSHSFRLLDSGDDSTLWSLDLREENISCPEWIRLYAANPADRAVSASA